MLAVDDHLTVEITGLSHDGAGIGHKEGLAIFVPGALSGEQVQIQITEIKRRYGRGKLLSVLQPSSERVNPPCPKYGICGGCQLQHLQYQSQLEYKRQRVEDTLTRLGKLKEITVNPVLGMVEPWHYRNKAQLHVAQIDGQLRLGYYSLGSHQLIPISDCLLLPKTFTPLVKTLEKLLQQHGIKAYNRQSKKGLLKHIIIKESSATGEIMLILVTNSPQLPQGKVLAHKIVGEYPIVVSVVQNVNPNSRQILGKDFTLLAGQEKIKERLGTLEFLISPSAFFQVNSSQATILYEQVLAYANLLGSETVFDLYSGIGTLSLFLAERAAKVYGVEGNPLAVEDAKDNASLNGIDNAEFVSGTVERVLPDLIAKGIIPDMIVLDPPRQGVAPEVLKVITKLAPPSLIYVSCDPGTLARDLGILNLAGYKGMEVQPVDMFPQTRHVETVVLMSREKRLSM